MIPSYPSLTFPNHYTLVTGLYPEHHGIVANNFYDPARKERYSYTRSGNQHRRHLVRQANPCWVLAEQQGMRTACFFWPGSEAEIDGVRPTYYLHFDDPFPRRKAHRPGHRLAQAARPSSAPTSSPSTIRPSTMPATSSGPTAPQSAPPSCTSTPS